MDSLGAALEPVPLPQPDPRNWAQRLPRIQQGQGLPLGTDVIPPALLLYALGIDPTRKHGDAMDYDAAHMAAYLQQQARWKKDI